MEKTHPSERKQSQAGAEPARRGIPFDISRSRHAGLVSKAMEHYERRDLAGARKLLTQVLEENEEDVSALHGLGLIARDMGKLEVALEFMKKARDGDPRSIMIASNMGTVLEALNRYEESLKCYKDALRRIPKRKENFIDQGIVYNNIGSVLSKMNRRTEALIAFRKAIDKGVEFPEAIVNMATMLGDVGEFKQSNYYFRKALEIDPDNAQAHHNFGVVLQRQGMFEEAWDHCEWRMVATNDGVPWRNFPQPLWNGNPFQGARLILHAEQGIGDEIRFASMIPEAIARGGEVVVECEKRLVSLFQRSFPQARIVPAPYWPAEQGVEPFDIQCPFGTLARLFRRNHESFPVHSGYLIPDPRHVEEFKKRLKEAGPGPYVGLCWRSGLSGAYRSEQYALAEELGPIFETKGVTYVNLQYDSDPEELALLKEKFGVELVEWEDLDLRNELERVAALTKCMDLVVAPATSVAVMGGAVGAETIEIRPRPVPETYFKDGRCPWFPSVRFFTKRQSENWSKVMRRIAAEAEALKQKG